MSSIEAYFNKILVLNLDRRPDRWAHALEELALCNITQFERVSGYPHPTNGNAGCTRSHVTLWREIAEHGPDRVLIFEDDFYLLTEPRMFEGGFQPFSRPVQIFNSLVGSLDNKFDVLIRHVPEDWDVLYLGAGYGAPPIARVNEHCIRTSHMMTTSSYAVSRKFCEKATKHYADWIRENRPDVKDPVEYYWGPIDVTLSSFADNSKFYCVQPRLFIQSAGKSDLTEREEYYLFSMTDSAHEDSI